MNKNNQGPVSTKRYRIKTDKKNSIIVEEVNKFELETVWNSLSEIRLIF